MEEEQTLLTDEAPFVKKRFTAALATLIVIVGFGVWFLVGLRAPAPLSGAGRALSASTAEGRQFTVASGDGFSEIAEHLEASGLVRNARVFEMLILGTGNVRRLKAGTYLVGPNATAMDVLEQLVTGAVHEATVTIPPGATTYEIDDLFAREGIVPAGALIARIKTMNIQVEGRLFPDTYRFFTNTPAETVIEKLTKNFTEKTNGFLGTDGTKDAQTLIIASLLEREVPDFEDRRIVAGIMTKRRAAGMPLQVDASVCYAKEVVAGRAADCLPLTALDLKIDSPYNTYTQNGWPPGPIGNPGLAAVQAALRPRASPYWFYLSDPKTHKTIFSVTLEEHAKNRAKYLH